MSCYQNKSVLSKYRFKLFFGILLFVFQQLSYAISATEVYEYYANYEPEIETSQELLSPNSFSDFKVSTQFLTQTGQLIVQQQDFVLPLRGNLNLPFYRVFLPGTESDSMTNSKWRWAFDINLFFVNENQIELQEVDGQIHTFNKITENEFVNQRYGLRSIRKNNQGYQLEKNQNFYNFDESGKLTSIQDASSNLITFIYQNGQLKTIDLYAWKTVDFEYNNQNQLVKVLFPTGKTINYAYNAGYLSKVTDSHGNEINYVIGDDSRYSIKFNGKSLLQLEQLRQENEKKFILAFKQGYSIEYSYSSKKNDDFVLTITKFSKDQSYVTVYACQNSECTITDPLQSISKLVWHNLYPGLDVKNVLIPFL